MQNVRNIILRSYPYSHIQIQFSKECFPVTSIIHFLVSRMQWLRHIEKIYSVLEIPSTDKKKTNQKSSNAEA